MLEQHSYKKVNYGEEIINGRRAQKKIKVNPKKGAEPIMAEKFELKANTTVKTVNMTQEEALNETCEWVEKQFTIIREIQNINFSIILSLALIDCFAQAEAQYPLGGHDAKEAFCDFVLKHSDSQRETLQKVCPVTLYYDYKEEYSFSPLPFISGEILPINEVELQKTAERYLLCLPDEMREKARERHQYIKLLYQLRNKLIHEMNPLGNIYSMISNYPSICSYVKLREEDLMTQEPLQDYWAVSFPKEYVFQLSSEMILHRLNNCRIERTLPFPLSNEPRKCELCWYDK